MSEVVIGAPYAVGKDLLDHFKVSCLCMTLHLIMCLFLDLYLTRMVPSVWNSRAKVLLSTNKTIHNKSCVVSVLKLPSCNWILFCVYIREDKMVAHERHSHKWRRTTDTFSNIKLSDVSVNYSQWIVSSLTQFVSKRWHLHYIGGGLSSTSKYDTRNKYQLHVFVTVVSALKFSKMNCV